MPCYTACLVFEIRERSGSLPLQYEEVWMLVHADGMQEAESVLNEMGISQESSVKNIHGEWLEWRFLGMRLLKSHDVAEGCVPLVSLTASVPGFIDKPSLAAH